MLTEEKTCDERPAEQYRRPQERRMRGKRAATSPGTVPGTVAADIAPTDESEFELQLRSTLA